MTMAKHTDAPFMTILHRPFGWHITHSLILHHKGIDKMGTIVGITESWLSTFSSRRPYRVLVHDVASNRPDDEFLSRPKEEDGECVFALIRSEVGSTDAFPFWYDLCKSSDLHFIKGAKKELQAPPYPFFLDQQTHL